MKQISTLILSSLITFGSSQYTLAASSDWQDLGGGKARVLAVKDPVTMKIEGVVEIQLDKGWKTYWRSPGDAGIPPEFDFSASNFVDLKDVQFPTPEVIEIPDTYFMGYHGNVRFVFEAVSFSDNASLNMNMLAGVCEEICIPATASFQISAQELNVSDPLAVSILDMAKLKLPILEDTNVKIEKAQLLDNTKLVIATHAFDSSTKPTLLLEGPNGWFSGPIENHNDMFTVDLGDAFSEYENWKDDYRYTILLGDTSSSRKLSDLNF